MRFGWNPVVVAAHHLYVTMRAVIVATAFSVLAACGTPAATHPTHALVESTSYPVIPGKVAIYIDGAPQRIVANGRSFVVHLVVVNGLGHPFDIPNGCNGWLPVGLESARIGFTFLDGGVACPPTTINPGITRAARTVITTYSECSQGPVGEGSPYPECAGPNRNQAPVLPPGAYHLTVETSGIPNAHVVGPARITLIAG